MLEGSTIDSNACLDALFSASKDIILVLNEDHLIKKSNPALEQYFPAAPFDKLDEKSFAQLIGQNSYDNFFKPTLEACIEKRKKATISKWSEYKGKRKFFQWTFLPIDSAEHPSANILAIAKDLTEIKQLKDEILQKDIELKSLILSETDLIFFLDSSLTVFDSNNLGFQFARTSSGNKFFIGDHLFKFVPEKFHSLLSRIIEEVLQSGVEIKRQKHYPKSEKYYEFTFKPIKELTGAVVGVVIIASDITTGKVAEKEMHLSRNKLKAIFDSSIQSIFLLGENFKVLEFNKRASDDISKLWNKTLAIGDNILDYFLNAIHEQFQELFNRALNGEKSVIEKKIDYPNGLKIWSEITFVPVFDMAEKIIGVSFSTLDITERKLVEARLRENEANLTSLIENNTALIWSVDRFYNLVLLNNRFYEFVKKKYNVSPRPGMNILSYLDNETAACFKGWMDKVYNGELVKQDLEMQLSSGKITAEIVMNPIVSDGQIIGASVFAIDVTERKIREIELEQINSSYRQEIEIRKKIEEDLKFKNNELDTFIYKASHDLRGPIASLMGLYNAATIEIRDPKSLEYLEYINRTAQRMDQVLKALINLSEIKDRPINVETTNLNQVIQDAMAILEEKTNISNIKFRIDVPDISFKTDAGLLMVIVKNLLENAVRYSRLTVESLIKVKAEQLTNKEVKLTISDNGLGMAPQIQDKVFNMFFKGNNLSPGSGLGLYMVKSASYKLGGKVSLKSVVNRGTSILVYLPDLESLVKKDLGI